MPATSKAISFRDELASELKQRLPALAQTLGFAADGAPTLLIGAGTTTTDSVFIKIGSVTAFGKDVLGLTQTVFTPHIAQLVVELNATGANSPGTWATRGTVVACLAQRGMKVELYTVANGNSVTAAGITGAPALSFEGHVQYPLMATL